MAELRWTLEALDWLEDIQRYIEQDNPQAAENVIDGILQKAEVLTAFPDIGTRLRIVPEGEVRMITVRALPHRLSVPERHGFN
jgi:plasmid stabilization system protein ParE